MSTLKENFWVAVAIFRMLPRLTRLCGRLVLWGARSNEDADRLLESSLFKREWEAIQAEAVEYVQAHVPVAETPDSCH